MKKAKLALVPPCFNFKAPDPELFAELSILTKAAYERWRKERLV
jgi:hypothetical protein